MVNVGKYSIHGAYGHMVYKTNRFLASSFGFQGFPATGGFPVARPCPYLPRLGRSFAVPSSDQRKIQMNRENSSWFYKMGAGSIYKAGYGAPQVGRNNPTYPFVMPVIGVRTAFTIFITG